MLPTPNRTSYAYTTRLWAAALCALSAATASQLPAHARTAHVSAQVVAGVALVAPLCMALVPAKPRARTALLAAAVWFAAHVSIMANDGFRGGGVRGGELAYDALLWVLLATLSRRVGPSGT